MNDREGDEEIPQTSAIQTIINIISPKLKFKFSYIFYGTNLSINRKQSILKLKNNIINQVDILINCLCLQSKTIKLINNNFKV